MNKIPYNLGVTLEKAQKRFAAAEPSFMAEKSGALYRPEDRSFTLPFLKETYRITYPGGEVTGEQGETNIIYQILYLHYLSDASGMPLKGEWISFKELPGGQIYITPFQNRAVKPFSKIFGSQPENFTRAAEKLGGEKARYGDLSYILPVFPRVPVMLVLWQGDEEFPPAGTILFDATAGSYLPTEDYAMLSGLLVSKLKAALK
jgi:hypothetical protein